MNHFGSRAFFVLFFLSSMLSVFSQKEFYNGFIIKESGDTVRGKIRHRETDYTPQKIFFRNERDTLTYTTEHLKEFMMVRADKDTVVFRKAVITYARSKVQLIELTVSDSALLIRDTVFLELVMQGPLKLYSLKTYNFRTHYYLQVNDSSPEELVFRKYYAAYEDLPTALVMKYKFQLLRAMNDCGKSRKIIEEMRYDEKELRNVFANYNTCFGKNEISYIRKSERIKMFFTLSGGFTSVWVHFPPVEAQGKSKMNRGNGYAAALAFNIGMSRDMPKLWLTAEVGINSYKIKNSLQYYANFAYHNKTVEIEPLYLKVRILPAYYFGRSYSKVVPYVNGGFVAGYLLKMIKNKADTNDLAVTAVKKFELGVAVSFGIRILNYVSMEARYELGDGFSYIKRQGADTHSLMLTARLNLGQKLEKKPI